MSMLRKPRKKCLSCGRENTRPQYKYCSNLCQAEYQYQAYIERWKTAEISGLQCLGLVTRPIKKYLRRKYGNKCCLCGWAEVNPRLREVPLIADHIDGNWRNNKEDNLRLICPNCDSLSPTFAALNKGNGRINRSPSKRAREASLNRDPPV